MIGEYDDIINLPHHVSTRHPQMSMLERAAQFSPFAALNGHGDAIRESERETVERVDLNDQTRDEILKNLQEMLDIGKEGSITYFVPDAVKSGGAYTIVTGRARKLDAIPQMLILEDGTGIPISDILKSSILRGNLQILRKYQMN